MINTKHLSIQSYTHPRKVFCLTVREIYSADEKKKKEREKIKREERGKKKETVVNITDILMKGI